MTSLRNPSRRRWLGRLAALGVGHAMLDVPALAQMTASPGPVLPPPMGGLDAAAAADPVAFLDRVGWGASAGQLQALARFGATAYLQKQLQPDPDPALPPDWSAQLAALPVNQPLEVLIPPIVRQERAIRQARKDDPQVGAADVEARLKAINRFKFDLAQQAAAQQVVLGLYARNGLQQRLSWFWLNHFNVFRGGNIGPMMGDYTQRVIAPHALGRFRDLLRATMFSPQMLLYLNNAQNARGHVNENYAREVMELHTLGVGGGYTQTDVTNLARVLTGLGVDLLDKPVRVRPALRADLWQQGLVVFNPARHDPDPKIVLGQTFQGRGLDDIDAVITLLADHPATARHVSTELAQYFVADVPPRELVELMVQRWRATGGQIAEVLRAMFTNPVFIASLRQPQFKDPMRYVLSALRATLGDEPISNPQPVLGMLARLGEPLFGRQTPDGYPLGSSAWDGSGQLTTRFEVARQIGAGAPALFAPMPDFMRQSAPSATGAAGETMSATARPPHRPPPDLARSAVYLAQQNQLGTATLRALAQADNRLSWNTLWLSSPEFMNA
ncbi:MAG: DUF1800 domain-containing protein [Pseudomonadota bacterium]